MHTPRLFRLALLLCASTVTSSLFLPAYAENREIPTVEQDAIMHSDIFVNRGEPDNIRDDYFRMGELGVLLPTYHREALFLAYRSLTLDKKTLQQQKQNTPRKEAKTPEEAEKNGFWLLQRTFVTEKAPALEIDVYKTMPGHPYASFINCGNGAFLLAGETLKALHTGKKYKMPELQQWLQAQDSVFERCGDKKEGVTLAPMPAELPASSALYLRQLRQYQIAAAHFYEGNYRESQRRFDAIASDKAHPLRAWASHSALRSMMRAASLDTGFIDRWGQIRASSDSAETRRANANAAQEEHYKKMEAAHAQLKQRGKLILADKSLASVHGAVNELLNNAPAILVPHLAYQELTANLGRLTQDPVQTGELSKWSALGDKLFDLYSGNHKLLASLRAQHSHFDWIRTIQGCTDNPDSPNYSGLCQTEHAHALAQWQAKPGRAWLVATLITAQELTPPLEKAIQEAKNVTSDSPEFFTVRYYSARLLRLAGRSDEAKAMVNAVLNTSGGYINHPALHHADSASNLFRQERFALAQNALEAFTYALRRGGLPYEADDILNRRLAARDLLRLANISPNERQMLVAAWWRADMAGDKETADAAASKVGAILPQLNDFARRYIASKEAQERSFILASMAAQWNISPVLFTPEKEFAVKRKGSSMLTWCSFDSADFKERAKFQRSPVVTLDLASDPALRDAEMARLRQIGSGADWLMRTSLQRYAANPKDREIGFVLQKAIAASSTNCPYWDDKLLKQAQELSAKIQPLTPKATAATTATGQAAISEQILRRTYDYYKNSKANQKEYRTFHLLVKSEDAAKAALAQIAAGASFESVARKITLDPGSKDKGGDLDWGLPEYYTGNFAAAMREMKAPGLYPRPVKTEFGWHLIMIKDIRPALIPTFEEMRPELEKALRKEGGK